MYKTATKLCNYKKNKLGFKIIHVIGIKLSFPSSSIYVMVFKVLFLESDFLGLISDTIAGVLRARY